MAELLEQIRQLSVREQLALIREIALNLESERESMGEWEISPEQKAQLDEVQDAYERDGNPGESWPTVRARIVAQAETEASSREKIAA